MNCRLKASKWVKSKYKWERKIRGLSKISKARKNVREVKGYKVRISRGKRMLS